MGDLLGNGTICRPCVDVNPGVSVTGPRDTVRHDSSTTPIITAAVHVLKKAGEN